MASVTVPSGNLGVVVVLDVATQLDANTAQSLLAPVDAAAAVLALNTYPLPSVAGGVNEFVVAAAATGAVAVPAGYDDTIDTATAAVTLSSASADANQVILAGEYGLTLFESSPVASGTIFGGGGTNTIVLAQTSGGFTIDGDGTDTVYLSTGTIATSAVAVLQGSASVTASGSFAVLYGSGAGSTDVITVTGSDDTVVVNASASTVFAAAGGVFYATTGALEFINGGASTLVGGAGAGAITAFGGSGASAYFQGGSTAPFTFVNANSNSSIISGSAGGILAFNSVGGEISLLGSNAGAPNYLVGGTGAETLNAAFSAGPVDLVAGAANAAIFASNTTTNAIFGGTGSSTVVGGTTTSGNTTTALADLFAFANGQAGGAEEILQWGAASTLVFLGYGAAGDAAIQSAIAAAPTGGSSSSITIPDGTEITLIALNGQTVRWNTPFYG